MNKNKIVTIGVAVVVITVAIAFGVWKPGKCTSINPLPDTNTIQRQCENVQDRDLCHRIHVSGTDDNPLCQWIP